MPKFRKKPIIVEAEQWLPGKEVEGVTPVGDGDYGYLEIPGEVYFVGPGDWIITGIAGERYSCRGTIFRATYEPIEEG